MANNEEISLREIIISVKGWYKYLLSKWVWILLFGIIGGMIGLIYAFLKKPTYTATTTFVLESGDSGDGRLSQYAGLASMVGLDLGGGGGGIFQGDNIIELYMSQTMIQKTLLSTIEANDKRTLLIDCYIDFKLLRNQWNEKEDLRNIRFTRKNGKPFSRLQDSIIRVIVKDIQENFLSVGKPNKKLSIIKVDVKSNNEFFSKVFNEQIVKNVNDFYVQTKTQRSLENVTILQQKTDSVRAVMNGAIYTAVEIGDATPNSNPTHQVRRIAPIQRSQFTAETNKTILAELIKNLEMSKIALRKETPLIQVVDQPLFPLDKVKVSKIKATIVGGLVAGIIMILILVVSRSYKMIMI